jgi:hypothetical protein
MMISKAHIVKNVNGNFHIKSGKIIGGACYAVIGEDTTLALTSKDIEGTNDSMISISASNAGEFLKYLKITDTVKGGSINIVTKASKSADQSLSGAFEMSDFIVKNNAQLMKLVYLSSTGWLPPNTDNMALCFNLCDGNFTIADNQINIVGRAVSPNIGVCYDGSYDRLNDNFNLVGISLPISSVLNHGGSGESLAANYSITGPLKAPIVSVKPMQLMPDYELSEKFGNVLPLTVSSDRMNGVSPGNEFVSDPFARNAFDTPTVAKKPGKSLERSTDRKFGVKITRGHRNI